MKTLGTNILSLRLQRNLNESSDQVASSFERLSSGLRINRPGDDAAGLSIASSLNADRRIYTQGIRNLNDAASALSIAEGALTALAQIVQRQRELAEQAANGVYSSVQRAALDFEADALTQEYNRIIQSTEFNGRKLLDGSFADVRVQFGKGMEESVLLNISGDASGIGNTVGDGTFSLAATVSDTNGDFGLIVRDLNGDGHGDLISFSNVISFNVSLGNGDGTFGAPASYSKIQGVGTEIELGDFNEDGAIDLVVSATGGGRNTIGVYLGNSDGSFQSAITLTAASNIMSALNVDDFDGDGNLDIVAGDFSANINIFFGSGTGTFDPRVTIATAGIISDIESGDFNNDGNRDIVVSSGVTLRVFNGDGAGSFSGPATYSTSVDSAIGMDVADLDGDGDDDVVLAVPLTNGTGTKVDVFLNNAGSGFTKSTLTSGSGPVRVEIADLNADGKLDLVTQNATAESISVFMGQGDGTFASQVEYSPTGLNHGFGIGDINGDGVLDIAVLDSTANLITILEQNATSTTLTRELNLTTQETAREALNTTSSLLGGIHRALGSIGSQQARLDVTINSLNTQVINYSAAESRILDADVATEAAALLQAKIRQQIAASLIEQMNLTSDLVLELLKP